MNFCLLFFLKSLLCEASPCALRSAPYSSVFRAPVPASTTDCLRQGAGCRREVAALCPPPTCILLIQLSVLPHLVCGPQHQAQRSHLITGNYLIAFLGPHKAPHAFPAASLSTRTPEWSCPQPPGHQRLGQACCPLICIGHLAPGMRRINLGLPHLV